VLLAAGSPGNRMSFPNSMIMIHEVQTAKCNMESNSSLLKRSKLTDKINKQLVDTLAKHTKKPIKKIEELMKEETYFTAEEAKEFGIIDKIVTSK
jgi:ATP-dependent Clp protease protease subunit